MDDFRDAVLIAMLEHPEHAEEIAQWASENGESLEESSERGPPPSPGLVFDETKHRWVRPEDHSGAAKSGDGGEKEGFEVLERWVGGDMGGIKVTSADLENGNVPDSVAWLHSQTQNSFKEAGITNRTLVRGLAIKPDAVLGILSKGEMDLSKAGSWTQSESTARDFAELNPPGGSMTVILVARKTPVDRIIASHDTFDTFQEVEKEEGFENENENIAAVGNLKIRSVTVGGDEISVDEAIERFNDGDISSGDEITIEFEEKTKHESSERGPPPSPGLIFDETKHRWVRPESADAKPGVEHALEGLADKLPEEAKSPGTWGKIKSFVASAGSAIYTGATRLGHKLHDLAPDILDVAADYSKIFYAGRGDSNQNTPDPFMNSLGVGSSTVAVIASHILGRASVWLRSKLAGRKQEAVEGTLSIDQKAKAVADLLNELNRSLGTEETVDAATVAEWLKSLEGQ